MADGRVPRYYWDSCVFLSAVEKVPTRVAVIERLLDDANAGRAEVFTSTVSITEVAFAKFEPHIDQADGTKQCECDADDWISAPLAPNAARGERRATENSRPSALQRQR